MPDPRAGSGPGLPAPLRWQKGHPHCRHRHPAACPGLVPGANADPCGTDSAGVVLVPPAAIVASPQGGAKSCHPCSPHPASRPSVLGSWGREKVFYGPIKKVFYVFYGLCGGELRPQQRVCQTCLCPAVARASPQRQGPNSRGFSLEYVFHVGFMQFVLWGILLFCLLCIACLSLLIFILNLKRKPKPKPKKTPFSFAHGEKGKKQHSSKNIICSKVA